MASYAVDLKACGLSGVFANGLITLKQDDLLRFIATKDTRIAELEELLREEYEGLLMNVCPVIDGAPDREHADADSIGLLERYEAILARAAQPSVSID